MLDISASVFAHYITSDVASKSDGSAYNYWIDLYEDLNPEAFLYVGDRPGTDHDIPHALGIQIILVYVKEKDTSIKALQLQSLSDIAKYLL